MTGGSEKRVRKRILTIRLSDEEYAAIDQGAERAGLVVGSYARGVLLGAPAPRQVRRPPVERRELVRLLGELGKVASNLNQLTRSANTGDPTDRHGLLVVLQSVVDVRNAILAALGRLA